MWTYKAFLSDKKMSLRWQSVFLNKAQLRFTTLANLAGLTVILTVPNTTRREVKDIEVL